MCTYPSYLKQNRIYFREIKTNNELLSANEQIYKHIQSNFTASKAFLLTYIAGSDETQYHAWFEMQVLVLTDNYSIYVVVNRTKHACKYQWCSYLRALVASSRNLELLYDNKGFNVYEYVAAHSVPGTFLTFI